MQCYECSEPISEEASWYSVSNRGEVFCCSACAEQFTNRLRLIGDVYIFENSGAADPDDGGPLAVIGVSSPHQDPPVVITTREEYMAAFPGSVPPSQSFFEPQPITVIELKPAAPEPLYVGDGYGRVARSEP